MARLRRVAGTPLTREDRRRLARAVVASALTGVAMYLLVMHIVRPAVLAHITDAQVARLRQAVVERPAIVLGAIVGMCAVAGLPLLGVFRWVHGPFGSRPSPKQGT
jgi:uncharacterized membrane protein YedE/YeeE